VTSSCEFEYSVRRAVVLSTQVILHPKTIRARATFLNNVQLYRGMYVIPVITSVTYR
jgi:hypothetical protein